ncbi:hypothetical protein MYO4S_00113 [Serratia phage 4S]|nr:hypothetical protein MYO4S_00113 [Serratia phage 4S]
MRRNYVELIEYNLKPISCQERIYNTERYKTPFCIQTKDGTICTVVMKSGYDGYWFEGPNLWTIFPEDVDMIEDRIWDHIKA